MASSQSGLDAVIPKQEAINREHPPAEHRQRLAAILRLLWGSWKFLCKVALVAAVGSSILALVIRPRYQSSAHILPAPNNTAAGISMLASLDGSTAPLNAAGNALGLKTIGALYVGLLGSRTVQDYIVDDRNLMAVYKTVTREEARRVLADNSNIAEDRKSGIIVITVTDTNPRRAAAIARSYIDSLNRVMAQSSTSSARQERIFLEERLKQVRRDLDTAQERFSEFSAKNTAIDIKEQGRAMVDAAARVQAQIIAAQSELQGLQQIYSPDNIRIRTAQAQVAELRRSLQRISGKPPRELPTPGAGESDAEYPSIRQLPLLGVSYADLYRQVKIDEVVYETLTKQIERAKVEEAREIPTLRVVDEPQIPERKAFPKRRMMVLGYTSFAVFLGIIWVLAKDSWAHLSPADPLKVFSRDAAMDLAILRRRIVERIPPSLRRAQRSSPPMDR